MNESTEALYNRASMDWQRSEPVLLSDYTARPFLLNWCMPVEGLNVLDLGCGEGYFARHLAQRGAGTIQAMDLSPEMVKRATEEEARDPRNISYSCGSATDLSRFETGSFDVVVAVFLFNYLTKAQSEQTMCEVARVLRKGGRFIFAVPHPSLSFLRSEQPPFYFSREGAGYFSGRDKLFEGKIWRRDGKSVGVRCVHKTLDDYFDCMRNAGFRCLPEVKELHVTDEMLALDPDFFGPLKDDPLHMAFKLEKTS